MPKHYRLPVHAPYHESGSPFLIFSPDVDSIVQAVWTHCGMDGLEFVRSRGGRFHEARAIASRLVRLLRKESFTGIGSIFGLRTHSSVGSVLDLRRKRLESDPEPGERCRCIMKTVSNVHRETLISLMRIAFMLLYISQ